jgi:hypothetical protein
LEIRMQCVEVGETNADLAGLGVSFQSISPYQPSMMVLKILRR